MPSNWWNRRSFVLTAAAVALASAIGAFATGVPYPEPVARATLGPDWECKRLAFVFTTCSGSCPATTHRMSQVAQALAAKGLLKDDGAPAQRVRLLSITLDPARDTPEALRKYRKAYDADPAHWTFLTGPREQVEKVHAAWGMWAKPAAKSGDKPDRAAAITAVQHGGYAAAAHARTP